MKVADFFDALEIRDYLEEQGDLPVHSPIDGTKIARVTSHTPATAADIMDRAEAAFQAWRHVPAPKRG